MNRPGLSNCAVNPASDFPSKAGWVSIRSDGIAALAAAAVRAPSGDNTQPWHICVDEEACRIDIHCDENNDRSPMNSGQRMSQIACGAAIENVLRTARDWGWHAEIELFDAPSIGDPCPLLARIHIRDSDAEPGTPTSYIAARVTNRRLYDARPVPPAAVSALEMLTRETNGVRTHWIADRGNIDGLAELFARGDATMFDEPSMRHAFLSKVRFDLPANAEADEGLPLAALEATPPLRFSMQLMKIIPNSLFRMVRGKNIFATHAAKLVKSSSGLCVIATDATNSRTDVNVGRAMQRAWLALTELGLAAQPMMSLMVLENALHHGTPELMAALKRQGSEGLLRDLRSALNKLGIAGRPAFILRFGYALPPSGRTGRKQP